MNQFINQFKFVCIVLSAIFFAGCSKPQDRYIAKDGGAKVAEMQAVKSEDGYDRFVLLRSNARVGTLIRTKATDGTEKFVFDSVDTPTIEKGLSFSLESPGSASVIGLYSCRDCERPWFKGQVPMLWYKVQPN